MLHRLKLLLAGIVLAVTATAANAQAPTLARPDFEMRFGVIAHSLLHNKEQSTDLNFELLSPRFGTQSGNWLQDFVFRPRVHFGGNYNLSRYRDQLYMGLTWDFPIFDRFYFEVSFGAMVHNGSLGRPREDFSRLSLGCGLLFRESVAIGYRLTERINIQAMLEHSSNAGLCFRNVGINNAGLRIGYSF
jgi:lipid A 3-O-deacylase